MSKAGVYFGSLKGAHDSVDKEHDVEGSTEIGVVGRCYWRSSSEKMTADDGSGRSVDDGFGPWIFVSLIGTVSLVG